MYADDIQLFVTTSPAGVSQAIQQIESCIRDVQTWLSQNELVMNIQKTEFIILGTKASSVNTSLTINGDTIPAKSSVRDLGVHLDSSLSMETQVNITCRSAFHYLKVISRQRPYLDKRNAAMLIQSLVLSRLDFCAPLLCGITKKLQRKVQRAINYSVRVVECLKSHDHISSALREHDWLPAGLRIRYRLALLTRSILSTGHPKILATLLVPQHNHSQAGVRTRSSFDSTLLVIPRSRTRKGEATFRVAAPTVWNSLPQSVRTAKSTTMFKATLLSHLWSLEAQQ
jgi:hypothetical protein